MDWGRHRSAGEHMQGDRHPDALRELAAECVALAERTIYFVPALVAIYRHHRNRVAISVTNSPANGRVAVTELSDEIPLAPK